MQRRWAATSRLHPFHSLKLQYISHLIPNPTCLRYRFGSKNHIMTSCYAFPHFAYMTSSSCGSRRMQSVWLSLNSLSSIALRVSPSGCSSDSDQSMDQTCRDPLTPDTACFSWNTHPESPTNRNFIQLEWKMIRNPHRRFFLFSQIIFVVFWLDR